MKIELLNEAAVTQFKTNMPTILRDCYGFTIIESGQIMYKDADKLYVISSGEAMSFYPNKKYIRYIENGNVKLHYFHYRSTDNIFPEGKIIFKDVDNIKKLMHFSNELERRKDLDKYSCKSALLWNFYLQYATENAPHKKLSNDLIISNAQKYLEDFFDNKISLSDVAKRSNLSYVQFFRRFKSIVGMSPAEYLMKVRMERAVKLLSETDLSIKRISDECGFFDEFYFSKAFKKYYNYAPTKYRKMTRQ